MADELVFYTNPMSRGRTARWMLEEVGQPYRTEVLEYGTTMKAPAFRAINPLGKVPALRHGGVVITEAAAICAYLADAFPQARLAPPPSDPQRGPYYRWLFLVSGPLEAAITDKALGVTIPEERKRMVGYGSLPEVLDTLEAAVATSPYLAGASFTAADLYVGAHLGFGMAFKTIDKRPAFEDYVARLFNRPAAVRANQIDDALIAERTRQPNV